jgi:MFS family permease
MLRFVLAMCAAEVLGMLSFASFQALIPTFTAEWGLSNSEAGLISGVYFAGYVAAVPVLVSLTDRMDPRGVVLGSLALGAAASVGFAVFAEGFWSALFLRTLHGIGLAGTYMPGLKALSDRTEGPKQSRYVAFYTASFGIGAALSYVMAGGIAPLLGWGWAFAATALGAAASAVIVRAALPAGGLRERAPQTHLLDFRPVLRNRPAMAYILGYCGHNWELFAFRSWAVAFLVYAATADGGTTTGLGATGIAALATLLGVPASIFGNELALRFGRRRTVAVVTVASVLLAAVTGFAGGMSWPLAVGLCLVYGALLTGDSAALTAGTVAAAAAGQRGATLAMHAFIGFLGGVFGPAAMGFTLDLAGGQSMAGWGLAFLVCGAGSAFALLAVMALGRRE